MEKTALIITDGAEVIQKMGKDIQLSLKKFKVVCISADDFLGTDLLPSDICFFGAQNPNPPSFSYLCKLLAHINLAGRVCGIFSTAQKTADYLCSLAKDSELAVFPESFLGEGDIGIWAGKVAESFFKLQEKKNHVGKS